MITIYFFPQSTGHVALLLDGLGKSGEKRWNIYLSFFPGNEYSLASFRTHDFADDLEHPVGTVIKLPSMESNGFGLSEAAIFDWWQQKLNPTARGFSWLANNCATIIYYALYIGQQHSASLKYKAIPIHSWFGSYFQPVIVPGSLLIYADKLAELMQAEFLDKNVTAHCYIQLKLLCEEPNPESWYSLATEIYHRIVKFNGDSYGLSLQETFCAGVKNTLLKLIYLFKNLEGKIYKNVSCLSYVAIDEPANVERYFLKLENILKYIVFEIEESDESVTPQLQQVEARFDAAIKSELIEPLKDFIGKNKLHFITNPERIAKIVEQSIVELDESKNPHQKYHQHGDNFRKLMPGSGIGLSRQMV